MSSQRSAKTPEKSPVDALTALGFQIHGRGIARRARHYRMRRANELRNDEILARRRPLYIFAGVAALGSVILRDPLLFICGLFIFILALLPELWYRYGLRALYIERTLQKREAAFGEVVEMRLLVENRKALPLPWLEVADEFPHELPILGKHLLDSATSGRAVLANTLALWAYQRVRRRYRLRAVARGVYHFGPATLQVSDPFGILTREKKLEMPATLIVRPIVAPIERLGLPSGAPFGERKSSRRLLEDPLRIGGIRDYAPGDEPRRIHWKATARAGKLQSKVYEPSSRHTLMLFLDVRTFPKLVPGYDAPLAELAICAAASIAQWAQQQGYAVGISSNGTMNMTADLLAAAQPQSDAVAQAAQTPAPHSQPHLMTGNTPRLRVAPSARPEQVMTILDELARLLPYYGLPMEDLLASERLRLPPGATLVYIGCEAAVDVPVIVALRQMRAKGHSVSLLLTRSDLSAMQSDGVAYLTDLQPHFIGGRELWESLRRDVLGAEAIHQLTKAQLPSYFVKPLPNEKSRPMSGADTANVASAGERDERQEQQDDRTASPTSGDEQPQPGQPRALVVE